MLYPKKKEKKVSPELYQNPTAEYRGTPFWAWNCRLDKKELLWQMEVLRDMGFGGGHMHVRTGMATPYLSDEYMDLISACVNKAKREKMLAWLYDEDRWPSGAAGGLVTKDPEYRQRYLLFTPTPYCGARNAAEDSSARAKRTENGTLLASFDVELDEEGNLLSYRRLAEGEEARGEAWYAYIETPAPNPWYNNQTYVNTLDKKAIRRFIEVTYETYNNTPDVKRAFGKTVPAIFTDEPQFTHKSTLPFAKSKADVTLPWTDDLEETFVAAYGESLTERIPELIWEKAEGVSLTRYRYHDHIAERFAEAFADQCGAWCGEHGIVLTGHMMSEPTLESQTSALGEAMRSYRGFQLPGIDMLCAHFELNTAKQCQSAVRQYGREGMLSELYGVTGWDFDFRGHKLHGDWQAAMGVTVRVPHLSWVSMKGAAKRDYPASIHYQSPWWTEYSYVEDHFARVNVCMTRGKPFVRVGVIHPVESYWLHWGPSEQTAAIRDEMDRNFENVTDWLVKGSMDFDFISESLLPDLCKKGGNPLRVGKMAYDAIVVPQCETLRSTTLERLEEFQRKGGRLIFLGTPPKYENAVPSDRGARLYAQSQVVAFGKSALLSALEDFRALSLRNANGSLTDDLIYQMREDGEGRWLFVAKAVEPYNKDLFGGKTVHFEVEGEWYPVLYDTVAGKTYAQDATREGGKTRFVRTVYSYDSMLYYLSPIPVEAETEPALPAGGAALAIPARVPYTLSEPNVLLLDTAEFALDGGEYEGEMGILELDNLLRRRLGWPKNDGHIAQPWTLPPETPEHTVKLRFTVECEVGVRAPRLALEDAREARIWVDGEEIAVRPRGYYTDKSIEKVPLPNLGKGSHQIEVELPFGRRTSTEWCYLLGNFGVKVEGAYRSLVAAPRLLGFDDITRIGLAHYGGEVAYRIPVTTRGGEVFVETPHYRAAVVRVEVDGERVGHIAYPPYKLSLGRLSAGEHTVTVRCYISRHNAFSPLHCADEFLGWKGPSWWQNAGDKFTESYRLLPEGLLSAPRFTEVE